MENERLYTTLAFAGTLPFVLCALLPLAGVDAIAPFGPLRGVAASYGLAIVSFLAGAQWATYLFREHETPFNLLVGSNVVLLAAWFAYLLPNVRWALLTQIVAFLVLLTVDYQLVLSRVLSADYFRARWIATGIASVSILVMLVS